MTAKLPEAMDPQRLADMRLYADGCSGADWIQDADTRDTIADLLADRDRLAAALENACASVAAMGARIDALETGLDKAYDDGWNEGCGAGGGAP